MQQRQLLIIPMFLLIFGPKSSGWLDVVSLTSAVLLATHFLWMNTAHLPAGLVHRSALLGAIFVSLFGYATLHYSQHWNADAYQVLRFGRVIVNFLGGVSLVSIYYRWFPEDAHHVILRHLFHCLVLHAVIMFGMFQSTSFRHLIIHQVVQADPDSRTYLAKATGYRIAGLTDSWDALSGLQSLGLLMLPILLTRHANFSYVYAVISAPLLLFSVAISGRTGFITAAVFMPAALLFADLRKIHRTTMVGIAVGLLGTVIVLGPLRHVTIDALQSTSLGRTVAMFGLDYRDPTQQREQMSDTLVGILEAHYFLPDDWTTFWLGTGGSGRDTWDYVPADNGLVMNLHNLGCVCFLLIYGTLLWMMLSGLTLRRIDPLLAGTAFLAVGLILLIDIKVMYAFSRNGFTVMLLPVLTCWWERARSESSATGTNTDLSWEG